MVSKNAPVRMQSGGTRVTRRTVTRGVAWSAPVVAVGVAAPAFAASPPTVTVTPCGNACKHPGEGQNDKTYHFTFCFQTNSGLVGNSVTLVSMTVNGVNKTNLVPTSVTVLPGAPVCIYVDAAGYADSANGTATLFFSYALSSAPGTTINGSVTTAFNALPPCGTGADPFNNPELPHTPQGDATHVPTNCVT